MCFIEKHPLEMGPLLKIVLDALCGQDAAYYKSLFSVGANFVNEMVSALQFRQRIQNTYLKQSNFPLKWKNQESLNISSLS